MTDIRGAYMRGLFYLATSGTYTQSSDPIAVMLVSANCPFDGTHNYVSSVSAYELSSTSYTSNGEADHLGRKQLASLSALESDALSGVFLSASSLAWYNMNESDGIGAMIAFVSSVLEDGSHATGSNELLFYHGFSEVTPNGTLTLNPNATSGLAVLQQISS